MTTIRDELIQLQIRHKVLRPETAVQWAQSHPKSALHAALEWDDSVAAVAYRIWQVRQLIAIHVVNEEGVRQMVSLTIDRVNAGGYRAMTDVLQNATMRDVMLADALADLERVRLKYGQLVELARVWEEAGKVRAKQAKRRQARSSPAAKRSLAKQAKRSGSKLRQERPSPAMQA